LNLFPLLICNLSDPVGNFNLPGLNQLIDLLLPGISLRHVKFVVVEHVLIFGDLESVVFSHLVILLDLLGSFII